MLYKKEFSNEVFEDLKGSKQIFV